MEGFKQQVAAVQQCQSALRLPEEVVTSLPTCRTAQTLQQEASQLQHTTIQQCNILQVEGRLYITNTSLHIYFYSTKCEIQKKSLHVISVWFLTLNLLNSSIWNKKNLNTKNINCCLFAVEKTCLSVSNCQCFQVHCSVPTGPLRNVSVLV